MLLVVLVMLLSMLDNVAGTALDTYILVVSASSGCRQGKTGSGSCQGFIMNNFDVQQTRFNKQLQVH